MLQSQLARRNISIADLFTAPVIQERREKRIPVVDTKEIFSRVDQQHTYMGYEECVEIFNDLAYIVIPFDKTTKQFQLLLSRLKLTLLNQSGNVKFYDLIDGLNRLGLENFSDLIKQKIQEGNYSRSPGELSAILFFLSQQHLMHGQQRDAELFAQVVKDLRFTDVKLLKIEHLHFLMKGLTLAMEPSFLQGLKNPEDMKKEVENFLPNVIDQISLELSRCNISDVIMMLESFFKFWNKSNFQNSKMKGVYLSCEAYLDQYLGLSKKDITGGQFAQLVEQIANAQFHMLYKFDQKLIHRMQYILVNDHSELYVFSIKDIIRIIKGFEAINDYFNRDKVINCLVNAALEITCFQDADYLELMEIFDEKGIMEQQPDLLVKLRFYFQDRFNYMERPTMINYLQFLLNHGMIFEDKDMMELIAAHLQKNYFSYELNELFKVYLITQHNFYRDNESIRLIEDATKIRIADQKQRQQVKVEGLRDLIEGLRLEHAHNKKLDQSLRTLVKETNLLNIDKKLFVQFICYAADFNIKIDQKLQQAIDVAFDAHLQDLTQQDLAHLILYTDDYQKYDLLGILDIEQFQNDFASLEKLALRGLVKLDKTLAMKAIQELDADSNLIEVVEKLLNERGAKYDKGLLTCNDQLKAAFLINDSILVDVIDHQFANSIQPDGKLSPRKRASVAKQLALQNGFKDYRLISLAEMDFAKDEQKYLIDVLFNQ
ncbi:UNKNOWN [Stylonychia lemnae]|uniref:Uncharacterized protein n=1 Tax=Stylonychia lemnae TaxID=5949 RepID=A0A077ZTN6_STYLE|nr:UNKNOWN [Stylonychia lemnae]|eukprot:CDW73278.1 UNKNOWN [Stylonychia lemnae]